VYNQDTVCLRSVFPPYLEGRSMNAMNPDPIEALDPDLRAPARALMGRRVSFRDIPAARAAMEGQMPPTGTAAVALKQVETEERVVPGPEGAPDVTLRIMRPVGRERPLPLLYWLHGGGYVLGSVADEEPACALFAVEAGCAVGLVEYRLAPEHPFPAGLEDCYAGLRWMASAADGLGIDRDRIAVGGPSAGGGLAAALALLARDRAEVSIALQLLIWPMIDDHNVAPPDDTHPDAVGWTREANIHCWRAYLGREPGGDGISHYAAPSRATDLKELPPAYVAVGDRDLLADEGITYARELIRAGVHTELHVYPGACHAFDWIAPDAEVSKRYAADLYGALRRGLR